VGRTKGREKKKEMKAKPSKGRNGGIVKKEEERGGYTTHRQSNCMGGVGSKGRWSRVKDKEQIGASIGKR